ncbi:chaplin [Streptomyces chattanoogensis]|uniref:Chaplin domain-containing protein n=1 Tax=Streptomyces chattanoogensis TaxID=66876 RepID=A0A0N0H2A1_9ACTN|nr:chaplin [Streptomyces chattanoogensis]KPC64930.1 hypothetical protein ADL29_09965 [Streptomyces chattanoogensis]
MKRFVKNTALAAVSCTMVLGSAGVSAAQGGGEMSHPSRPGHFKTQGGHYKMQGGHGHGHGAKAKGFAVHSPGVLSGNVVQVPINIPINVCGNTVDIFIAVLNPAFGNICINK